MGRDPTAARRITFLSAGTDGNDGPTDAAGAYADMELVNLAAAEGLSITDYLENNDAYHFFDAIDGLMKTGPTNTNVCDIQLILIF
jgi:glycerate 2-kinase